MPLFFILFDGEEDAIFLRLSVVSWSCIISSSSSSLFSSSSSSSSSDVHPPFLSPPPSSSLSLHPPLGGAPLALPKSQILITLPPSPIARKLPNNAFALFKSLCQILFSCKYPHALTNCFISDLTSSPSICPRKLYKSPPSANSNDKYTSKLVATNFPPINFLAPVVAGFTNTSKSSATFGCDTLFKATISLRVLFAFCFEYNAFPMRFNATKTLCSLSYAFTTVPYEPEPSNAIKWYRSQSTFQSSEKTR